MSNPMPNEAMPELLPEHGRNTLNTLGLRGTRPLVLIDMTGGSKTASSKD
jgi:hypothetical protein